MVPPASHRTSRIPWYSGYPATLSAFRVRDSHPLWLAFPDHSASPSMLMQGPTTPTAVAVSLGFSAFARRYLRNLLRFLFLRVLRCFNSPGLLSVLTHGMIRYCLIGFPHSDTFGSKPLCDSPKLFAAFRVLHRLSVPRHSPLALSPLTSSLPHLRTIT